MTTVIFFIFGIIVGYVWGKKDKKKIFIGKKQDITINDGETKIKKLKK
jgi:uncharacterized membrane protein YcaP (DUF421 family)